MKIYANQLKMHLKKGFTPLYLISGDVPTLIRESVSLIRAFAQKEGFKEVLRFQINLEFDWIQLKNILEHFSLFQEKQIIELTLQTLHLNATGIQMLEAYIKNPSKEKLLILITPKLDLKAQKVTWIKKIIETNTYVPIWPLDFGKYIQWIQLKLEEKSLLANKEALILLAKYTEGNYDSAIQTIEKLSLAYSKNTLLTPLEISETTVQASQYDLYDWIDACLSGNINRMIIIFKFLQGAQVEPAILLWSITQEIRKLMHVCIALEKNFSLSEAFKVQEVWDKKQPLFQKALNRHSLTSLESLIEQAFQADKVLKGARHGKIWENLMNISLYLTLGSTYF